MTMTIEQISADIGVKHLISSYATSVDGRQREDVLALFAAGASVTLNGNTMDGNEKVAGWIDMLFQSPPGIHMTVNTVVDYDPAQPNEASALSDVAFVRKLEDGWKVVAAGKYIDKCVQQAGEWLFSSRTINIS